jgi:hypothetical protein
MKSNYKIKKWSEDGDDKILIDFFNIYKSIINKFGVNFIDKSVDG